MPFPGLGRRQSSSVYLLGIKITHSRHNHMRLPTELLLPVLSIRTSGGGGGGCNESTVLFAS
jgi:hypothetical protein